jgi:hypothetical protein
MTLPSSAGRLARTARLSGLVRDLASPQLAFRPEQAGSLPGAPGGFLYRVGGGYPLTAPAVIPATMYLWSRR